LIRWFVWVIALVLGLEMVGCVASGFRIERVGSGDFEPSAHVELLRLEPSRPYSVLAKFSGTELAICSRDEAHCTLRDRARALGANAVWIQQTQISVRPEQWLNIDGRMTRIPPANYETISGVLIRYRD
jgi:hypothetical protein